MAALAQFPFFMNKFSLNMVTNRILIIFVEK